MCLKLLLLSATLACPSPAAPQAAASGARADFAGTWVLESQTTSAWRGRGATGNHEAPVVVRIVGSRLEIRVQAEAPGAAYDYDLSGTPVRTEGPKGIALVSTSRWDGDHLVTVGTRIFSTREGGRPFGFQEIRSLSADGTEMTVKTTIEMFPQDLVRISGYRRAK